jgi:hypothetical protein
MYLDACRKIAWQVPVSNCRWFGTTNVCFSPFGPARRNLMWLPRWVRIEKRKCWKVVITSEADSLLSLGIGWLNFHRHNEGRVLRKSQGREVLSLQEESRRFS